MNKSWLMQEQKANNIVRILQSWRLWLVGALIGSIGGGIFYQISPPPFQAQSVVIIDHNIDQAWPFPFEKETHVFLGRENFKLESIAWSDKVIGEINSVFQNHSKEELKYSILNIDKSQNGQWVFYAQSENKEEAIQIVSKWTSSFVREVIIKIRTSKEIEIARAEILEMLVVNPDFPSLEFEQEFNEVFDLLEKFSGISPFIELNITDTGSLIQNKMDSLSNHLLIGSIAGITIQFIISFVILHKKTLYEK